MNVERLKQLFPNASPEFLSLNSDPSELRSKEPKQDSREALEHTVSRKSPCGKGRQDRYSVEYRVYSRRPKDWDNNWIKPLQDCLVNIGIIPNDDWKTLEGKIKSLKANSKEEERTEIVITKL